MWQLSVNCSNDHKSAGQEKEQCLEDYHWRFGHTEIIPRLLNDDQKEDYRQVCQEIIKHLYTESDLVCKVTTGDKTWIFDYNPEIELQSCQRKSPTQPRSKKVKQSEVSRFDPVLQCERHHLLWVLTTGLDNQSTSLQVCVSLIAWEEMRVIAGQNLVISLWQCTCKQYPWAFSCSGPREIEPYWKTHPVHLILFCVTFFFFPSSRGSTRGPI